jgi:superfamily II DNA helicase RecQ
MTATAPPTVRQFLRRAFFLRGAVPTTGSLVHEEIHPPRRENVRLNIHASAGAGGNINTKKRLAVVKKSIADGHVVLIFADTVENCKQAKTSIDTFLAKINTESSSSSSNATERRLTAEIYHGNTPTRRQAELVTAFEEAIKHSVSVRERIRTSQPEVSSGDTQTDTAARAALWGAGDHLVVIIATIAFGMGVDIMGINKVVLWNTPRCTTDMIQQVLRGGRDGAPCQVDVFVSWTKALSHLKDARDLQRARFDVGPGLPDEAGQAVVDRRKQVLAQAGKDAEEDLRTVLDIAHASTKCRWAQVDAAFGFPDTANCGNCDVCLCQDHTDVTVDQAMDSKIIEVFQAHTTPGAGWTLKQARTAVLEGRADKNTPRAKQAVSQRLRQLFRMRKICIFKPESGGDWMFYNCSLSSS